MSTAQIFNVAATTELGVEQLMPKKNAPRSIKEMTTLATSSLYYLRKIAFVLLFSLLSSTAYSLTCSDVDGAYVYASNGTYLGFFGSQYATDSIHNSYGAYGVVVK